MSGIRIRSIRPPLGQNPKLDPHHLIKAISHLKPSDANPKQYYNFVREMCIMHNCGIYMGLKWARIVWPDLSQRQRESYNSEQFAELPIPMPERNPQHVALQKKLIGPKTQLTNKNPKPKPTLLSEKRPKVDNQKRLDLKVTPNQPKLKTNLQVYSNQDHPIRVHLVRSISELLSKVSTDRRRETNNNKRKIVVRLFSDSKESDEEETHSSSDKNNALMLKVTKRVKRELETKNKNNKKYMPSINNARRQRIR
ncbi:hypothetical protein KR059_004606 [Drosophila kikkawai]|nr:hypothetical protein KR059_004606 [Drosophila kikkawai]